MKTQTKERLKNKGWKEHEVKKAEDSLEKKSSYDVHFSKIVFWSALVVIIFANLIVSVVLIPFLIVLQKTILYAIIAVLAGTIGFLYNFLITDIGHLEKKHHVLASILIPIIAFANMVIMVAVSNNFTNDLQFQKDIHNPWVIAIFFAVVFIIPSLISQIMEHIKKKP